MHAKTKIGKGSIYQPRGSSMAHPIVPRSDAYVLCRSLVVEFADNIINDVLTRYEEYQNERLEYMAAEYLDCVNATMLTFESLSRIDFRLNPVSRAFMDETEPLASGADNYNRKVLDHRTLVAPKSAIELYPKALSKVKSALSVSKLPRNTLKRQPRMQNCLQIDFNTIYLKRVNSMDQQLRMEKANSKLKAKIAKFVPKVS